MKNIHYRVFFGMLAVIGAPVFAQAIYPLPVQVFGQYATPKTGQEYGAPPSSAPNLLEGRELNSPFAVAVDGSSNPAMIYVVDTGNHRVLGWKDSSTFKNGAPADVVLGQRDMFSNVAHTGAALASFSSGLYSPTSVAVDRNGNVFVMDSGNNRVLRYRRPAAPRDEEGPLVADLVIGQAKLSDSAADLGQTTAGQSGIRTNATSTQGVLQAGLAFDAAGNLWVTDSGNHRVLRFSASNVSGAGNTGAGSAVLSADYVLGQPDFSTSVANAGRANTINDRIDKGQLRFPSALAFDASGNLLVIDDLGRVLVYQAPFDAPGKKASRILGIFTLQPGQPAPPAVNDATFFTLVSGNTLVGGPRGLFTVGDYIFVADTGNHRIVRYDPVSTWAPEGPAAFSPSMTSVFGQDNFSRGEANNAPGWEPSAQYLDSPSGGAFLNGEVILADTRNHRVLIHPYNAEWNFIAPATRIIGQIDFSFRSPNLIEGREFGAAPARVWLAANSAIDLPAFGLGSALDFTVAQPRLYVADTLNNRVLGYRDARRARTGDRADLVIGQVGFFRSLVNSPSDNAAKASDRGLAQPGAVAVDAEGNLWVADTGNGRIVRFPRPFDRPEGPFVADLVIGQPDFEGRAPVFGWATPTRELLFRPSSLAFTPDGHLVVSDMGQHRVLLYRQPFANGQPADVVLGQQDFTTGAAGNSEAQLNMPMGVAVDTSNRLYVADLLNRRLLVWDQVSTRLDGATAALAITMSGQPQGVTVNPRNGKIWVADSGSGAVHRYPEFLQLLFAGGGNIRPEFSFGVAAPRSVLLDKSDNLWVTDFANRLSLHVPDLTVVNGLNGFQRPAPAMLAQLSVPGVELSAGTATAQGPQLPKELGDLQLFVNGVAAPLSRVASDAVRFIIPKATRPAGLADFVVQRISTGEIVAYSRKQMYDVSPAVMYQGDNPGTTGQARALNADGSPNTSSRPAASLQEMTVYATGFGAVAGLPDDGATGQLTISGVLAALRVIGTTSSYLCTDVSASLDPDEPGIWRIKVKLPQVAANGTFGFAFSYASVISDSMTGQPAVSPRVTVNR